MRFLIELKSFNFGKRKQISLKAFKTILLLFSLSLFQPLLAQRKAAFITGKVLGENESQLAKVSIIILGRQTGIATSDSGTFRMKVPAEKAFALVFSYAGYRTEQRNFLLNESEEEQIVSAT